MTSPNTEQYEFPVTWTGTVGGIICVCVGRVIGPSTWNQERCQVAIDQVKGCYFENSSSTDLTMADHLPTDVKTEVNRLIGTILDLDCEFVKAGMTQYINPP